MVHRLYERVSPGPYRAPRYMRLTSSLASIAAKESCAQQSPEMKHACHSVEVADEFHVVLDNYDSYAAVS